MSEVARKYYKNYKNLLTTGFDVKKVMNDHQISQSDVDRLRQSCENLKNIPKATPDQFYVLCLVACEKNFGNSAHMLDTYCKIFQETPEWFCNRDMNVLEVQRTFDHQYFFTLPPIPGRNYNLMFYALKSYDTKHFNFDEAERAILMTVSANLFLNGPRNGHVFIYDMKGSKLGHALKPKMKALSKMMKYVTEGALTEHREIHILNTTSFVSILMCKIFELNSDRKIRR